MKAENFIELIEQGRFDKISQNGMILIAKHFRQLQAKQLTLAAVSKSFAVGVEVEITDCIKGHEFDIGEKVELVEFDDSMWIARNKKGTEWYINEEEANVC